MNLGVDINLKQKQNLSVNKQLIQNMNILQYNVNQLDDYINSELEKNPLLEKEEIVDNEIDWENYIRNVSLQNIQDHSYNTDNIEKSFQVEAAKESLKDMLNSQLNLLYLTIIEKYIGEVIIDYIDENGYLSRLPKQISRSLNIDEKK